MMKTIGLLFITTLFSIQAYAQDDFEFPNSKDIGLNITNVLTSFLGNSNNSAQANAYPFIAKINRKKIGYRFGLGVNLRNANETITNSEQFIFNNYEINARIGVERKKYLGYKFGFFYGIDLISSIENSENTVSNDIDVTTRVINTYGVGGGPSFGFEYYFNKLMYLGTEGSLYGLYSFGKSKEMFLFNEEINEERTFSRFQATLSAPTRLYIMVRF